MTPNSDFFMDLNWNKEDLAEAKKMMEEWENRPSSFYDKFPKYMVKVDLAEREHAKECIKFWENRLNNETK